MQKCMNMYIRDTFSRNKSKRHERERMKKKRKKNVAHGVVFFLSILSGEDYYWKMFVIFFFFPFYVADRRRLKDTRPRRSSIISLAELFQNILLYIHRKNTFLAPGTSTCGFSNYPIALIKVLIFRFYYFHLFFVILSLAADRNS